MIVGHGTVGLTLNHGHVLEPVLNPGNDTVISNSKSDEYPQVQSPGRDITGKPWWYRELEPVGLCVVQALRTWL